MSKRTDKPCENKHNSEKEQKQMKKPLSSALTETNRIMVERIKEGAKTAGAVTAQRLVTSQVLALFGESLPKEFLETPIGKALTDIGTCYLAHTVATMFPNIPGAEVVKEVAGLAAQGATSATGTVLPGLAGLEMPEKPSK
jgi:hypothetical protein